MDTLSTATIEGVTGVRIPKACMTNFKVMSAWKNWEKQEVTFHSSNWTVYSH
jgi:hypothetical protein